MKPARVLILLSALLGVLFPPATPRSSSAAAGSPVQPGGASAPAADRLDFAAFEQELESIRKALSIPGMSAAVVEDQEIIWLQGFGYADLDQQVAASGETPYQLASVTKPIAATLVMQLVEDGLLSLDDPVERYGIEVESDGQVLVRHLLNHTSQGTPGEVHFYDGDRYALLGAVIERAAGEPYAELLSERILQPAGMVNSAPNPFPSWDDNPTVGWEAFRVFSGLGRGYSQFPGVYRAIARPYQFDKAFQVIDGSYQMASSPAAGLIATVEDLARFDIALDRNQLLPVARLQQMFTPTVSTFKDSETLQYGLGWYVQDYQGTQFLWHAGRWPPSVSALYLKVPDLGMSFIVLANSDKLSTPFNCLSKGDLLCSTLALSFYSNLVFPRLSGKSLPAIDWQADRNELVDQLRQIEDPDLLELLERELLSYRQVFASSGDPQAAGRLETVHRMVFGYSLIGKTSYLRDLNTFSPEPVPVIKGVWEYLPIYRAGLAWLLLTGLSLVVLGYIMIRLERADFRRGAAWFLVVLVLGPVGLVGFFLTGRSTEGPDLNRDAAPLWKTALALTLFRVVIYALWVALALQVLLYSLPEPDPPVIIGLVYLIPLLVSILLPKRSLPGQGPGVGYLSSVRQTALVSTASLTLMFLGLVPALILLMISWFPGNAALLNPLVALVLALAAGFCVLLNYPINLWLLRRGRLSSRAAVIITPGSEQDLLDSPGMGEIEPA